MVREVHRNQRAESIYRLASCAPRRVVQEGERKREKRPHQDQFFYLTRGSRRQQHLRHLPPWVRFFSSFFFFFLSHTLIAYMLALFLSYATCLSPCFFSVLFSVSACLFCLCRCFSSVSPSRSLSLTGSRCLSISLSCFLFSLGVSRMLPLGVRLVSLPGLRRLCQSCFVTSAQFLPVLLSPFFFPSLCQLPP